MQKGMCEQATMSISTWFTIVHMEDTLQDQGSECSRTIESNVTNYIVAVA